jgi:acetyl esterase/lipase
MIHGGGHVMLSRKDVRPEQVQWLLRDGFLPISVDYRLCPETNLSSGPIVDVADALVWARETLPRLKTLRRSDIVPDDYAAVPTFLIHPSLDDLITVAQAERMYTALKARGIEAQLRVVEGPKHLFDVYPRWKADRAAFDAVTEGYGFLKAMVS